ncbi:MAG TPA: 2OG-Fe(II) oxygenase [Methylophilaceae bacterium]|jgi:hypothetical protein
MRKIDVMIENSPHFIGAYHLEDALLCDELIQFFEVHQTLQKQGTTTEGINVSLKNSLDLAISPSDVNLPSHRVIKKYIAKLFQAYTEYAEQWPFLKKTFPILDIGRFNIQKYNAGGHFAHVHSERTDITSLHRLFAFMTYLNDDFEGGNTHFIHQQHRVKPEKGKTLIWPAEWTHAHAGEVVTEGSKYIVTGWMLLPHQ